MASSMYAVDMTSKTINAEENKAKKLKVSEESDGEVVANAVVAKVSTLGCFTIQKVLSEDLDTKCTFLEAIHAESKEKAVLILEKEPFSKESTGKMLTEETALVKQFDNDVYSKFRAYPKAEYNGIQITVIYPATKKHIEKYQFYERCVVRETPEIYRDVVAPYIASSQFSLQWVYNVLEHKSEKERIMFEDPDPEIGFVLLPDMKWNEKDTSCLYVSAICQQRNLKSLRDLDASHLPLLKNIWEKSVEVIAKKHKVPKFKLLAYFHYQPSYYHLHVHFTHVDFTPAGRTVERANLLETVIDNLEMFPNYYKESSLVYTVKKNDPLYVKLKEADVFC